MIVGLLYARKGNSVPPQRGQAPSLEAAYKPHAANGTAKAKLTHNHTKCLDRAPTKTPPYIGSKSMDHGCQRRRLLMVVRYDCLSLLSCSEVGEGSESGMCS